MITRRKEADKRASIDRTLIRTLAVYAAPWVCEMWVDDLVVNGSAGLSESTRAILRRADLTVVPVQPSGIDVQSAAAAVKLIKQAQSVRQGPPQALMFRLPCGKGDKAQNRSNGVVGETYTHYQSA